MPSRSGYHQPCRACTVFGLTTGVSLALRFTLPRTPSIQTQSPSCDAVLPGSLRVNFHGGFRFDFPQPGNHAVLAVVEHRGTPPGYQDKRIVLVDVRCAYRALDRLFVVGQRVEAPVLPARAVKLYLAGGCTEARLAVRAQQPLLVAAVGHRAGRIVLWAPAAQGLLQSSSKVLPQGLMRSVRSSRTFFQGTDSGLRRLAISKLISQSDLHSSTETTFWMAFRGTPVVKTESFSGKVAGGQDDIGDGLGGGCHEQVYHHVEVQFADGLVVPPGVLRGIGQEVIGLAPESFDRVGLAGLHLLQHQVGLSPGAEILDQRVAVGADAFSCSVW